jgi:hypothetical protein
MRSGFAAKMLVSLMKLILNFAFLLLILKKRNPAKAGLRVHLKIPTKFFIYKAITLSNVQ